MKIPDFFYNTFDLNLGSYSIAFPYFQAVAIVGLLFLLILSLAQFRRHYIDFSFKGAVFGIFFGFLLTIILEGFLLIYGKTALTAFLGWENAPKPLSVALEAGKAKLTKVLGVKTQNSENVDILKLIQSLPPIEAKKLKSIICTP